MGHMLKVVQAFDRAPVAEVPADDAQALDRKLATAAQAFRDRAGWLQPHQRMAVLQRAATLLLARQDEFTKTIAQEGGKPWTDARVEVLRAADGLRDAAEELRSFAGREVPMGLTSAS